MNILALDLGTSTGWAALVNGVESSGVWKLATDKELKAQKLDRMDRRNDLRITRLFQYIGLELSRMKVDWCVYEDCQFLSTQLQSQLWASLRAAIWLQSADGLKIDCVPVGTLKKFATGKGNATKEEMVAAIPPSLGVTDHNEADALHMLHFFRHRLGA